MFNKALIAMMASVFIVGCGSDVEFGHIPSNRIMEKQDFSEFSPYAVTKDIFNQPSYDKNTMTIKFRALDAMGEAIDTITKNDVIITENANPVNKFKFYKTTNANTAADIIFVLDITGSMEQEINSVKDNVRKFVETLKTENILANLCLVTFKDTVHQRCVKFTKDDPTTTQNENLDMFINEVSKIKVRIGDGGDNPENQLAALISAAEETPWNPSTQRVAIMITDAEFHDVNNPGDAGSAARSYQDTLKALADHQMTTFIVGPKLPGYETDYMGQPSLPSASNGKFFDIDELIESEDISPFPDDRRKLMGAVKTLATKPSLTDILDEIATIISTHYTIVYEIEDNDLDPTLKQGERSVHLTVNVAHDSLDVNSVHSSMPLGRPHYFKKWTLTSSLTAEFNKLRVFMDKVEIDEGYKVKFGKIYFDEFPPPGAEIQVHYEFGKLRDNIIVSPIIIDPPSYKYFATIVMINGQVVKDEYYKQSKTIEGRLVYEPAEKVFAEEDPFNIRGYGGFEFLVSVRELEFPGQNSED